MLKDSLLPRVVRGGIAGGLATVGMTAAMLLMHRCLPARQRYGLPPELIVDETLERVGLEQPLTQPQFEALAMLAHHGFGVSMGAVYGVLEPQLRATRPVVSGSSYGLLVWALSYLGWLSALEMEASATKEPHQRNALTIASHVIWGASLGALTAAVRNAETQYACGTARRKNW